MDVNQFQQFMVVQQQAMAQQQQQHQEEMAQQQAAMAQMLNIINEAVYKVYRQSEGQRKDSGGQALMVPF
uniref:Uncharacterized protein n=1 Tax=Ditylenchus dipsaci TaxID=166011 RepID=A0A915D8X3_9BILA